MANYYLEFDQFIRSVEISKEDYFSFFLGAGASISSQIPSAVDCIWMWKRTIYSSQTGIQITDTELMSDAIRTTIQNWLNNQGTFPEAGSASEYQEYVELCYPIEANRSNFFKRICQGKQPSIGYKLLMLMHERGILHSIWTTNFDELIYNSAVIAGVQPVDITLDAAGRIYRPQNKSELLVIKLHGDYRYGPLKNTENELADQDPLFRERLIDYLSDKHLVIAGYSGRDKSIMDALKEAYSKNGAGTLYWCGYGRQIPDDVKNLLDIARSNNRTAFYIPTDGFDKLMVGLSAICVCDDNALKSKYDSLLESAKGSEEATPFSMNISHFNTVIKSNLFEIEFPKEVLQCEIKFSEGESRWQTIRALTFNSQVVAVPKEKVVWAFGISENIYDLFKDRIVDKLVRVPVVDWVPRKDTALHHLFLTALTKSLAERANLDTDGRDTIWLKKHGSQKMVGENLYFIHQAIKLSFVFDGRINYLAMSPHFHISCTTPDLVINKEIKTEIGRVYFEKIYNNAFNDYINEWRGRLIDTTVPKFDIEYPVNSGTGFRFSISRTPLFGKVMLANASVGVKLADNFPHSLLRFKGIQYKEPMLLFGQTYSNATLSATSIHPMKGLVKYKPYDHISKSRLDDENIQLGVISPAQESAAFSQFLQRIHKKITITEKQKQYLLDYPGFYEAYGISINIADVGTRDWLTCQEPEVKSTMLETCRDLRNKIIRKIDELVSDGIKKVVVICIPDRWLNYTSFDDGRETFDLHDYVKAYCAEKSIPTQFIQEDTLRDTMHCQINWWLSLSYFVKSLRTPWVLQDLNPNTAFAGMGYSVNRKRDSHEIVLGCSHIYNAQGVGLKYRLSKLEDELIWDRQDRPHLSYNDAFKFGLSIIDVFSKTMEKFPDRVVIHKRNYFTEEEKKGLIDSIKGYNIKEIDLIEINYDDSIRFVSSKINAEGQPEIQGYPVKRGTCILLNKSEALLWTHGVVPALNNEHFNFYLGGRYIPGPLKITKHYGNSNIGTIATEILGLTKVDWNSFNMYTKLPATISSSNEIARIGKLLSNREGANYDYRYFI